MVGSFFVPAFTTRLALWSCKNLIDRDALEDVDKSICKTPECVDAKQNPYNDMKGTLGKDPKVEEQNREFCKGEWANKNNRWRVDNLQQKVRWIAWKRQERHIWAHFLENQKFRTRKRKTVGVQGLGYAQITVDTTYDKQMSQ